MILRDSEDGRKFLEWLCTFPDDKLVKEIRILEELVQTESVLMDIFIECHEALKDEAINRFERTIEKGGA